MRQRETITFFLFTTPIFAILLTVLIYPVSFCAKMSLSKWDMVEGTGSFTGLAHYGYLLRDPHFWGAVKNVFYIAVFSIPLEITLGFSLALLINKAFQEKGGFVNALIAIPMITAPVISGLFWRWLLNPNIGIVNYFLSLMHIPHPLWFASGFWALTAVIIANVWRFTSFVLIVMYAGLQSLPRECIEASIIDGATSLQRVRYVVVPLLKRLFLFIFIIRSADIFKSFDIIYVLTGGGPGSATETPSLFTYNTAFTYLRMGRAAASGIIVLILSLVLIVIFIRILYLGEKKGW